MAAAVERKKKDYSKGKIYKINVDGSDLVYYGSTCQTLAQRMTAHRSSYKNWKAGTNKKKCTSHKIFEIGDPIITWIEDYPCEREEHLVARERWYMDNNPCVNKQRPGGRTIKEYREEHKDKIAEYNKKYWASNKDKISKKYYCDCGCELRIIGKSRHEKTPKHIEKMRNKNLTI